MEKLELKHLAPYLPYGLKFRQRVRKATLPPTFYYKSRLMTPKNIEWLTQSEIQKPILRPLRDLSKEIKISESDGSFIPLNRLLWLSNFNIDVMEQSEKDEYFEVLTEIETGASYMDIEKLIEWHFDVFGLIEKGLAIDINTLNK